MKIKMTVTYGEDICEYLKEAFGCSTDEEFLIAFRAIMKAGLVKEAIDPNDLKFECEKID